MFKRAYWSVLFLVLLFHPFELNNVVAQDTNVEIQNVSTTVIEDSGIRFVVEMGLTELEGQTIGVTLWVFDEFGVPLHDMAGNEIGAFTSIRCCDDVQFTQNNRAVIEMLIPATALPQHPFAYKIQPFVRVWNESNEESLAFYGIQNDFTEIFFGDTLQQEMNNDDDGDGIVDGQDLCPGNIPGASRVDATGCPGELDPFFGLSFDDETHRRWYRRFWTGSCAGLLFRCLPGDPKWFDVTEEVVAGVPIEQQGLLRQRMWALGVMVGFDWARDNDIGHISTSNLREWGNLLERRDVTNPNVVLDTIALQANMKLRSWGRTVFD
ncbi:MAG: hypothetical protein D6737_14130 [Chloroflexi bacterium]|nr:MAG: hypothetical protein CUN54_06980 [Phototrophicales bacterium]RMF78631.1 MAG: hypothetical protein D6737_14130 [Chloroflexota bacterium]